MPQRLLGNARLDVYVAHDLLIQIHQFCLHRVLKPQKHYYISVNVHKAKHHSFENLTYFQNYLQMRRFKLMFTHLHLKLNYEGVRYTDKF